MKIGIDISQLAYPGTGVANYLQHLIEEITEQDTHNEYILFFSSLRRTLSPEFLNLISQRSNVHIKKFRLPLSALDMLWNKAHKVAIESFIGNIDIFITSDWTDPPVRNEKKATILYDLIVYKYPEETAQIIVETQKRKLAWTKKETSMIFCISEATKQDAKEILGVSEERLSVIYPGVTL
jgi:hypothetical protein